jgi:DNA-directed RNA polymerase subunit M/transcription elongation factor TFIIS
MVTGHALTPRFAASQNVNPTQASFSRAIVGPNCGKMSRARQVRQHQRAQTSTLSVEEDVPAVPEIMPPTGDLSHLLRADRCPECVTNVVSPYRVAIEDHGFTAYYHCRPCAHHWYTGWAE